MVADASGPKTAPAPGPRGVVGLGSFLALCRRGQVRFYLEDWREFGDLYRFRLGSLVAHVVVHPDDVRRVLAENRQNYAKGLGYAKTKDLLGEGLLTSEGERWQRQRRLMQPPFTPRAVAQFAGTVAGAAGALLPRWRRAADEGWALDIRDEMLRLALALIGSTMFSAEIGAAGEEMVAAYTAACAVINQRLASFLDLPLAIPTPANRRFGRALRALDRIIGDLIAARQRAPDGHDDLLAQVLRARDPETGAGMDPRQVRDEVMTIFFAGHETTANTLAWCWYLLARHPEVEARLHDELATVLAGRPPAADDLPRLRYTRMVFEETLRLYPPVWTFPRQAVGADVLGGYAIPAGSLIFPCQYLTHRHPAFWPDPERFDPERFAPERADKRTPYAYYPFGGGPRTCVGVHFAVQEACLVLATLAQHYRLRPVSERPVEPVSVITLHPAGGMWLRPERREGTVA